MGKSRCTKLDHVNVKYTRGENNGFKGFFWITWKSVILISRTEKSTALKAYSSLSWFEQPTTAHSGFWKFFSVYPSRALTDLSPQPLSSYALSPCDTKHRVWRIKELHAILFDMYQIPPCLKIAVCWANYSRVGREKSTRTEIWYIVSPVCCFCPRSHF